MAKRGKKKAEPIVRGRSTVYNSITTPEKIKNINPKNMELMEDFLDYLQSIGRAKTTIKNYRADLLLFLCWCEDELDNKYFVDLTKREIARFQNHALNVWGWSSNRLRTVKATLSSMSNYIENILDDEIVGFKPIINKIESPPKMAVRDKTIWTEEEIENLLNTLVKNYEYEKACFVALGAYSGRRKAELCRFRVSDFDDSKLVCGGSLYKSDPIQTKGRGGGKYLNCYTLAHKFKPFLDLWMNERERIHLSSEWLFPNKEVWSEQLPVSTVNSWAESITRIVKKPFYFHSLRHFYTTMLSENGIPDNVIKDILGWSDVSLVEVYRDTSADESIGKYFDENGIKQVKPTNIGDI